MIIGSFAENQASITSMTNENGSYPKANMLTKYTRQKAKATTTSTTISATSISAANTLAIFGINAKYGTLSVTGGEYTDLYTQTITSNTTYAFAGVVPGETVAVTPGITLSISGATSSIVSESLDFTTDNLQRDRYYKSLGGDYQITSMSLALQGAENQEIGLFWIGRTKQYGFTNEFDGSGYSFMCTSADYKAIDLLDKRVNYITQASTAAKGDTMLYGSIALSSINYDESKQRNGSFYGDTSLKVSENG